MRLLPPARRPFLYDAWFDYSVTRALRRWKADVFVSTMACSAAERQCHNWPYSTT